MERGSKVQRRGRVHTMKKGGWMNKMGRGNALDRGDSMEWNGDGECIRCIKRVGEIRSL